MRSEFVRFALRLTVTGARASRSRLLLMTIGVAVGVALLIGGLGVAPAIQARQARILAREPVKATGARDHNVLLWTSTEDQAGDRTMMRYRVASLGSAPIPPGLGRVPRYGELFVSPGLRDLLTTPLGKLLRPRLPGRIAGTVGSAGLLYPDELVAYSGVAPGSLPSDVIRAAAFGHRHEPGGPVSLVLKLLVLIAALGLLVPILVFIATSTRLSAALRERRIAAIRLVGATPTEVRVIAAVESGSATALGSLLGVMLFFVLRPAVAAISLGGLQWFPSDVAPPVPDVVAVVVMTPLLAVAVAMVSMRRSVVSPLGVVRRARVRRSGVLRLLPLVTGLAGLGVCWANHRAIAKGSAVGGVEVGVSLLLVLIGLSLAATWPGTVFAGLVARGGRVAGLLGARRLQSDPNSSGRVVTAFALLVFFGGVIHALIPSVAVAHPTDIAPEMRPSALLISATQFRASKLTAALAGVPGVTAVVPFPLVNLESVGTIPTVDCRLLRQVVTASLPHCSPSTAYIAHNAGRIALSPGATQTAFPWLGRNHHIEIRLPDRFETTSLGGANFGMFILPPGSLPQNMRRGLMADEAMVATDGRPSTAERVRNALASFGPRPTALTFREANRRAQERSLQVAAGIDLAVLVALGIALANLLVVTVDHIEERRRPFAFLAASGVSPGVLKGSIAVEIAVPLLSALFTAAIVATMVAALLGAIGDVPTSAPVGQLASLGALAIACVAAGTALTFPFLSRAAQSETLQFE